MLSQQSLLNYIPNDNALKDKTILVTGAADGIGKAVALAYARFGATVILADKEVKKLEAVYDQIMQEELPEPAIYPVDFQGATADHYQEMQKVISDEFGKLDGLVLNAAWLPTYTPIKVYEVELWAKVITANLHANFLLVQYCLPLLEKTEKPAIVYSSHKADKAYNGAYGVAKAGLDSLMSILCNEYDDSPYIRINGIDSGPLRTSLRTYHYPGENPATLAPADSIVGPYLYFMDSESGNETGELMRFNQLEADFQWPGSSV